MAAKTRQKGRARQVRRALSIGGTNVRIFGLGLIVLGIGYFLLSRGPYDSFWSLTLAPIVLLIGYLVVIPYAILKKKRVETSQGEKTK